LIPPWRLYVTAPFDLWSNPAQFGAWSSPQVIRPDTGQFGHIDLLGSIGVTVPDDHVFLGPRYGPDAEAWPLRFQEGRRRGRGPGVNRRVTPVELSWLVERNEVAPRRLAVSILDAHAAMGRAFAWNGSTRKGTARSAGRPSNGLGWETYIRRADLRPVATAPDPGNDGAVLRLFDIPGANARVLVMRNGSPDRSGALRLYAEVVPSTIDDPVAAAAWQYGCPVEAYRQLQRRT
jgi:hypothetical protein